MQSNANQIIQSFWHGPDLTTMEIVSIRSFLYHGHEFHLYCYEKLDNIPMGCQLFDANKIVDIGKLFYDSKGGLSGFANYFRINLLFEKGGWWVDLDMICLKPFNFNKEYCFCSEKTEQNLVWYTNCCIKSPSKSDFLKMYIEVFHLMLKKHEVIPWLSTGPVLINKLLNLYESQEFIQAPIIFCPINYFEVVALVDENRTIPSESYAVHLYNEMWRMTNLDKNKKYPRSSIYEFLKRKYL